MRGDTAEREHGEILRHQTAQVALRDQFLRWQCRARQKAVRMDDGRPSLPMRPRPIVEQQALARVTVLINKRAPYAMTPEFRHLVLRTQDPRSRHESGLQMLAADYYQRANEFSDCMTALFGPDSFLVDQIVRASVCALEFGQPRQYYLIPCSVENLSEHEPAFQATYWHNRLFNPAMPPGIQVLAFTPDWSTAQADPSPV